LINLSWFRGTQTAGPRAFRTADAFRSGRGLRLTIATILGIIWACSAAPPAAQAHAIILESAPAQGSTGPSPRRLILRFNSRLEKPLCSVQLVGPRQRGIALLRQEADAPPDTLAYPLPALEPGEYQARWKVMAADGHITEGTVAFTVTAS
jgi:methionine-rich copper-binding protein CopC